jgi:hypothetical protein
VRSASGNRVVEGWIPIAAPQYPRGRFIHFYRNPPLEDVVPIPTECSIWTCNPKLYTILTSYATARIVGIFCLHRYIRVHLSQPAHRFDVVILGRGLFCLTREDGLISSIRCFGTCPGSCSFSLCVREYTHTPCPTHLELSREVLEASHVNIKW